jgi:hypothetical protein
MRRILVPAVVTCALALSIVPAQARYGQGRVDTWLRAGDRDVDRNVHASTDVLSIHLTPGVPTKVKWFLKNLGGQPSTHSLGFSGCHSDAGIGFRYFTPGGREVSWKVTHKGFVYPNVAEGHTRKLAIRLLTSDTGNSTTCELEGWGLSGYDGVGLKVWS